jgi:uncharacterized protein (TIRG00374 family)
VNQRAKVYWSGSAAIVLGIGLSALFVGLAVRRLDWNGLFAAVAHSDLHPWLYLSVLSYIMGHFARGVRTRLLVSRDATLSSYRATSVVVVGYTVNNMLPARLGELARCGMLSELTGISFQQSAAVVISERLLDGLGILVLLGLAIPLTGSSLWPQQWLFMPIIFFGIASAVMLLVVISPNYAIKLTTRVVRFVNPAWQDAALRLMISVINGVSYLRAPSHALAIFLITVLIWLLEAGLYLFLMPAFGVGVHFRSAISVMALTNLGLIIPSSPGFVGSFHFFCMKALTMLEVPRVTALGYATVVHLAFFIPVTLWGLMIIVSMSIDFARIRRLMIRAEPVSRVSAGAPRSGSSTASRTEKREITPDLLFKLTEAALPLHHVPVDERYGVTSDVANFVAGQIRSLPRKLYWLLYGGMLGFRLCVHVRYLRAFQSLPIEKRAEIFDRWAYGKMPLARQLLRPLRSTALLAFYEHPAIATFFNGKAGETALQGVVLEK